MRKGLMIRFLLGYLALSLSMSIAGAGINYLQDFIQTLSDKGQFDIGMHPYTLSLFPGIFVDGLYRALNSVLPSLDAYSLLLLVLDTGLLALGALLFAEGVHRQYAVLCAEAECLETGSTRHAPAASGLFVELQQRLSRLAARMQTSSRATTLAEGGRRGAQAEAQALLAEAVGQLDVVLEAGLLAQDGAAQALLQDVLLKIHKAETNIGIMNT